MLRDAGIDAVAEAADVDEGALKVQARKARLTPAATALMLADVKALAVSMRWPEHLIVGADQVLVCAGRMLDKPATPGDAAETLRYLRGRMHRLLSAVSLVRKGEVLWRHAEQATLTMRHFSEGFLARYMAEAGEDLLTSVGAYRVEGRGLQLFSHMEGDHFTILGMPLLALMDVLRRLGALEE